MWGLFKKNIKKMENSIEVDLEVLDKELGSFGYKWTKGENDGVVCEYSSVFKDAQTGIVWVNFKDGNRINYSLLNEFMIQLDRTEIKPISPQNESPNVQSQKNVILGNNNPNINIDKNPILSLLEKQKPNWVNVEINLKLNLPTKSLYNVLTSSFDDAEEKIIEFVVNDLDIEIIRESLRINIKDIYKTNGNTRKSGNNNSPKDKE